MINFSNITDYLLAIIIWWVIWTCLDYLWDKLVIAIETARKNKIKKLKDKIKKLRKGGK